MKSEDHSRWSRPLRHAGEEFLDDPSADFRSRQASERFASLRGSREKREKTTIWERRAKTEAEVVMRELKTATTSTRGLRSRGHSAAAGPSQEEGVPDRLEQVERTLSKAFDKGLNRLATFHKQYGRKIENLTTALERDLRA